MQDQWDQRPLSKQANAICVQRLSLEDMYQNGDRDPISAGTVGEAVVGTDQWRMWECRRTRTWPTRLTVIWLTAGALNRWTSSTMRSVSRL